MAYRTVLGSVPNELQCVYVCYGHCSQLVTQDPRLKDSKYKWKDAKENHFENTAVMVCTYISFAFSDIRTTHPEFTEIIFHILLAVSFFHSSFLSFLPPPPPWKHLMLSCFGNSLTTTLPVGLHCLRDRTTTRHITHTHAHTHIHFSLNFT